MLRKAPRHSVGVTGDRATSATISQRKCSHHVCNQRAATLHRSERGRAFLLPGLYLWVSPSPGAAGLNVKTSQRKPGSKLVIRLLLPLN